MVDESTSIEIEELGDDDTATPEIPTAEDVKDEFTAEEIAMGREHKVIVKDANDSDDADDDGKKDAKTQDAKQIDKSTKSPEEDKDSKLSEEEEELQRVNSYTKNERGLYFKQKKETRQRQQAELERDEARIIAKDLENKLKEATSKKTAADETDDEEDIFNIDDDTEDEKPKEEVLTVEKFKKMEEEKAAEAEKAQKHSQLIRARVIEQGQELSAENPDVEPTLDLTKDLLDNHKTIFKDSPKKMAKLSRLYNEWLVAVGDALNPNRTETAADLAYEIGQMHPNYGKKAEAGKSKETVKKNVERIIDNAGKRASSASVSGGGGRKIVTHEDMTLSDLAAAARAGKLGDIPKAVRDRILREEPE